MPTTDQVIVEFIADTSQLTPGVDQLESLGALDSGTAVIFQKTNQALRDRAALFQQTVKDASQLTASVSGQQESYNKLVASVKNLSGASKDAVQQMLKFASGDISQAFKSTKTTVDDYTAALNKSNVATVSGTRAGNQLTTQLNQVKNALAALGPRTAENATDFDRLAAAGGRLQNELQNTRGLIRNLSSEAPVLNAFSESVNGLAGAFQASVGAAALFGDENKDLQETLVKVTSVTAIAQGVQQALNLVNKTGAITTLQLAIATKVQEASVILETAAESKSIIVRVAATVAQKALNLAMELNPIGIVVIALSAFIAALELYTGSTKRAAEETAKFNALIDATGEALDAEIKGIQDSNSKYVTELQARNAKESEIQTAQQRVLVDIQQRRADAIQELDAKLDELQHDKSKEGVQRYQDAQKQRTKIDNDYTAAVTELANKRTEHENTLLNESLAATKANADARVSLATKNSDELFAAQRVQLAAETAISLKAAGDDEEKKNAIRAAMHESFLQIQDSQDAAHEAKRQSVLQANLLNEQTASRRINSNIDDQETADQIKILKDRAKFELGLRTTTAQDRLRIEAKLQQDIEALQRDQLNRDIVLANENQNARNKVVIDSIQTTDAQRLQFEIDTELNTRAIALRATDLTEDKRRAIIADSEQKIRALKIAAIDQEAQDEIRANQAAQGNINANLQKQLDAQDEIRNAGTHGKVVATQLGVPVLDLNQQKDAIDKLTQFQLEQNAKLTDANADKFSKGLISEKEFNQTSADLYADNVKTFEDGEEKKRQASKKTADFQRAQTIAIVQTSLQGVSDGLNVLGSLYAQQDAAAQQKLDAQKQRIQDELDAGNISAKQAAQRNRELDLQEKKLQYDQAKRAKQLALFQAIISTAEAVVVAFTAGPIVGIIQGAIAAALGAAQIAIIASQPLPSFNTGKKDSYQGFGEVAERGRPEMIESNGRRFIARQKSIVWLGARDKVYTPDETAAMMSMNTTIPVAEIKQAPQTIDYDKIGKAVADNIPGMSLSIDGYKEFIQERNSFRTILNARRKWK